MSRVHTCTPSWEVPNGHLAVHTGGRTPKHDGSDDHTVGVGSHVGERDEKDQRTEPIERPRGDGVLRRGAGDAAARSAHPRPDHRPRPPAASGVPVRGCAQAVGRGRRTERVTAPDSWLRFTWRLIPPSGSLAPATPRKALPYHKTASYTMACKALPSTNFPPTMGSWTIAERSSRLSISEPETRTPGKSASLAPDLDDAIREYLRTYVLWRGIRQATETFGVSRHTLWRFLERGHTGRALPRAVMGGRGRQRRGAGSGNMGHRGRRPCACQQATCETLPVPLSPVPGIGGHAAPVVRRAPGHRG